MNRPSPARLAAVALIFTAAAGPAAACPTCDAGVRARVWAGVFGPDFAGNLVASLLPFVAFGLAAAALHGRGPAR